MMDSSRSPMRCEAGFWCVCAARVLRSLVQRRLRLRAGRPRLVSAGVHQDDRHPDLRQPHDGLQPRDAADQKVRAEFIGRGKYQILPDGTGVDALLTGEVTSRVASTPAASPTQQLASRYAITMTARDRAARHARRTRCSGRIPASSSGRNTRRRAARRALDPAAFFGQDTQRARPHEHRLRAHHRQRHPRGVLVDCVEPMPSVTPAAVRKQIAAGTPDPIYLLQGEDEVEKSALGARVRRARRGRAARVQRRAHSRRRHDDRRSGWPTASRALVAAARTLPMMAPRRVVIVLQAETLLVPKRESEAATRALDELEALLKQPEPQTTLVLVAGAARQAQPDVQAAAEAGDARRMRRRSRIRPTPSAGSGPASRRRAPRSSRRRRGCSPQRAGTDVKRLRDDVDRLLLYALGQKTITARRRARDRRAGGAAGRLGDDQRHRSGQARRRAAPARADARRRRAAGERSSVSSAGWCARSFRRSRRRSVRPAVDALFRTDLDLKRSAGDPRVLLERLVVELCAGKRRGRRALVGLRSDADAVRARCDAGVVSRDL